MDGHVPYAVDGRRASWKGSLGSVDVLFVELPIEEWVPIV
jgi:hypothetical protein